MTNDRSSRAASRSEMIMKAYMTTRSSHSLRGLPTSAARRGAGGRRVVWVEAEVLAWIERNRESAGLCGERPALHGGSRISTAAYEVVSVGPTSWSSAA